MQEQPYIDHTEVAKDLASTELDAMYNDTNKRQDIRLYLALGSLTVAGTILTAGILPNVPPYVLFVYPLISIWLALWYKHNQIGIDRKNDYIEHVIEAKYLHVLGLGFLTYKRQHFNGKSKLATHDLSIEGICTGLFITSKLLLITLGVIRSLPIDIHNASFITSVVLFCMAVLATIYTIIKLFFR